GGGMWGSRFPRFPLLKLNTHGTSAAGAPRLHLRIDPCSSVSSVVKSGRALEILTTDNTDQIPNPQIVEQKVAKDAKLKPTKTSSLALRPSVQIQLPNS